MNPSACRRGNAPLRAPDAGAGGDSLRVPDAGAGGDLLRVPDAGAGGDSLRGPDAGAGGVSGRQLGISSGELEVIMKRLLLAGLVLTVPVSPALAAEQTVSYKSGDETVSGLLVTPDGKGPFPGVVVIHEWWGLDDWVKSQARALAREGYAALA